MQQAERVQTGNRRRSATAGEIVPERPFGESYAELTHDARNMVTALALYCELLQEPGVLNPAARHFAQELQVVTAASRRLLEKLVRVEPPGPRGPRGPRGDAGAPGWRFSPLVEALPGTRLAGTPLFVEADRRTGEAVEGEVDLAAELELDRNLLDALAGPGVRVRFKTALGACPVRLDGQDLTRVLVNLVRNASEAMGGSGTISIALEECAVGPEEGPRVRLTVEDNGPGIPDTERVFEAGYSTRNAPGRKRTGGKLPVRRGLGLSIVRKLVEEAGGRVVAGNRAAGGARIAIELPLRMR